MSQNKFSLETRELVLRLKAHTTLPEDLSFILSPYRVTQSHLKLQFQGMQFILFVSTDTKHVCTNKTQIKIFPSGFLFWCVYREGGILSQLLKNSPK